jgi:hypothetical protein
MLKFKNLSYVFKRFSYVSKKLVKIISFVDK